MRYDGSVLGISPRSSKGLELDEHLRWDINALLYYYITFAPMPTKWSLNYVTVPAQMPMYQLARSTPYKQC